MPTWLMMQPDDATRDRHPAGSGVPAGSVWPAPWPIASPATVPTDEPAALSRLSLLDDDPF
jgi:hypothetical protein